MLEVHNLRKSFQSREVLKDVSFSIKEHEIITILGKNGAGKTTILNSILKLVHPDNGFILFNDKDIQTISNKEYFKNIGVVLESSSNVYDYLSGYQNIEYFLGLSNIDINQNLDLLNRYLDIFDMKKDIHKKVGDYSRGMVQKLAIMIALLGKPKLLLLDEPTLGLDIQTKYLMLDAIKQIVKDEGINIILTTHQMEVVKELYSKILLLRNGCVEEFESCEAMMTNQDEVYQVTYNDQNSIKVIEVTGKFKEIYDQYKDKDIIEIKKVEQNLEKIIMEKLNESIKV